MWSDPHTSYLLFRCRSHFLDVLYKFIRIVRILNGCKFTQRIIDNNEPELEAELILIVLCIAYIFTVLILALGVKEYLYLSSFVITEKPIPFLFLESSVHTLLCFRYWWDVNPRKQFCMTDLVVFCLQCFVRWLTIARERNCIVLNVCSCLKVLRNTVKTV